MMELHRKILNESKKIWNKYKDKDICDVNPYFKEIFKEENQDELKNKNE